MEGACIIIVLVYTHARMHTHVHTHTHTQSTPTLEDWRRELIQAVEQIIDHEHGLFTSVATPGEKEKSEEHIQKQVHVSTHSIILFLGLSTAESEPIKTVSSVLCRIMTSTF